MNPYSPPDGTIVLQDEPPRASSSARRWFMLHVALWGMILGSFLGVVPRLMTIAADFGIALSPSARWVASTSEWVRAHVALTLLALVAILWADRGILARSPQVGRPWRVGFWLSLPPLAIWLATVWAVYSTLM
ncbi:MAG: hypothetical protein AB7I30_19480, partial [Isosphaeraceae bacterium]